MCLIEWSFNLQAIENRIELRATWQPQCTGAAPGVITEDHGATEIGRTGIMNQQYSS